jgi:hypothetical protein
MEREDKRKAKGKPKGHASLRVVEGGNVIAIAKGQGKDANGLTGKQEAFCQGVGTRGETLTQAYRSAYDCQNMAPSTVNEHACRLMANDKIKARVNALAQARMSKSSHDAARIKASVIERLQIEANDSKNPASVRVRALELLGKMTDVSLFVEKIETTAKEDRTPEAIHEEIKAKLAKLAG